MLDVTAHGREDYTLRAGGDGNETCKYECNKGRFERVYNQCGCAGGVKDRCRLRTKAHGKEDYTLCTGGDGNQTCKYKCNKGKWEAVKPCD